LRQQGSIIHGMHTVLAQPTDSRAPARIKSVALRLTKAAQRHKPTQAHSKQSSQHDTIETALTVRVPSAQRYSSSRVYGSRCKPQAGKVSGREHHNITSTTTQCMHKLAVPCLGLFEGPELPPTPLWMLYRARPNVLVFYMFHLVLWAFP
jgi:hypothetical protein